MIRLPIMRTFDYDPGNDPTDPSPIAQLFHMRDFIKPSSWLIAGQLLQMQKTGLLHKKGQYCLVVSKVRKGYKYDLLRIS